MTGRKGRVVQDQISGDVRYESRSEADIPLGMISHKKSLFITIFGHKHKMKNFIKKFVIFH